jgi:long-chain acyl-CoA synthetase
MHLRGERRVEDALRGRHLLLTGFTGFLGKVWAAFVLERAPEIGRITLLVRGRRDEPAEARVRAIIERSPCLRPLRERHGEGLLAFLERKIDVVEGDVREPLCGLDPDALARLAPSIDAVVHCAGLTDFSPDPLAALAVNVRGGGHAADVAARTRGKRLVHVSTCFVAGSVDGEIPETLTPGVSPNGTRFDVDAELIALESACCAVDAREGNARSAAARRGRVDVATARAVALGWPNVYTYTKGLAEHLLAPREDVALTVVRPSIVECAREFPFPGWNEGLNTSGPIVWMCAGYAWKVPMRGDNGFDVVPVDTVARGMTLAIADALDDRAAPVYQLASGDHARFTFGRALDLTALKVRKGYTPSEVSALERLLLTHLDATPLDHGADRSVLLPAAQKATKWLKDALGRFDPSRHLPASLADERGDELKDRAQKASLRLNKASMLLKSVDALWKSYQPFIHDYDYRFVTSTVRARTARLDADERTRFGWDLEGFDWRQYWMEVEIPGLDLWSLPLLRGKDAPEDEGFDLGGELPLATRLALPSPTRGVSEGRAAEGRAAEGRAAEDRAAEDRAAEDRAAEDRAAEDRAAEGRAEQRSTDAPSAKVAEPPARVDERPANGGARRGRKAPPTSAHARRAEAERRAIAAGDAE